MKHGRNKRKANKMCSRHWAHNSRCADEDSAPAAALLAAAWSDPVDTGLVALDGEKGLATCCGGRVVGLQYLHSPASVRAKVEQSKGATMSSRSASGVHLRGPRASRATAYCTV